MDAIGRLKRTVGRLLGGELRMTREDARVETFERDNLLAECQWVWPGTDLLRHGWNALLRRWPLATTFQSPTWLWDGVGPGVPHGKLRLLTVRDEKELLLVLPLELSPSGFLDSAGYAVSDYLDPAVLPERGADAWGVALALLKRLWDRGIRGVTLHNVRPEAQCRAILPQVAQREGLIVDEAVTSNAARLQLPTTWETYLESLDPHERKELRRKIRKAETQAAARMEITDAENVDKSRLATALDLIEAANVDKRQWLTDHVHPLLSRVGGQLLREGRMRLQTLMLNDAPAACLIEFPTQRGPLLYNSGFDPNQRQWSPGAVAFGLAIKEAIEHGCPTFDFLRGREEYKYRMGAIDQNVYRLGIRC